VESQGTAPIGSPVLVPFDGSRHAEAIFPYVPLLANDKQEVILLQVIPQAEAVSSPMGHVMVSAEELRQASLTAAHGDLQRAATALLGLAPDLRIEPIVEIGDPSERTIEVARARQARSIALSNQGHSASGPHSFGSVVSRVVRTAPVPVIVARLGGPTDEVVAVSRFVVAHDGSDRAAQALPIAQHLAHRHGATVHVVAVVEDEESPLPAAVAANIDPQILEGVQADALNAARQRVEAIGASLLRQGLPASWQVLAGPAAATIIGACGPRDILVITSHGQSGSRWMLGSIAEKLVREAPIPVILLRTPPDTRAHAT
jgi:nucleotide-binding universal stress UspA family protein